MFIKAKPNGRFWDVDFYSISLRSVEKLYSADAGDTRRQQVFLVVDKYLG